MRNIKEPTDGGGYRPSTDRTESSSGSFCWFPSKKCLSFGGGGGLQFPMARAQTETTAKFEDCDILTFFDESAAWRLSEIVCCLFFFWFVWGFFCPPTHTHVHLPLEVIVLLPETQMLKVRFGLQEHGGSKVPPLAFKIQRKKKKKSPHCAEFTKPM